VNRCRRGVLLQEDAAGAEGDLDAVAATRSDGSAVTVLVWTLPVGPPSAAQSQPEKTMPLFW